MMGPPTGAAGGGRIPGQGGLGKGRNNILHPGSKGGMDPFGKINSKARKVIESVERQRQTPADPGAGSTGGSFDDEIEYNKL
jgi:hypothetical protein